MTASQYKRQSDIIAQKVYTLYEALWVDIQLSSVFTKVPRELPPVPASCFGRYFYYGNL